MSQAQEDIENSEDPTNEDGESERAYRVWDRKFGARQVSLGRDDANIFNIGRYLGGGGIGIVHETKLGNIPLAIKRTYARKLTTDHLNEIEILSKLSEQRHQRHHHIVQLIGSYIHQQRSFYELGLLIWPVAYCDLSALLNDLDTLVEWLYRMDKNTVDITLPMDSLSYLVDQEIPRYLDSLSEWQHLDKLVYQVKLRLQTSFGCIAKAVAYIHHHGIRHKDLKPSQILLSPNGLWLADFGWSADRSKFSQSATSGGDKMTMKYQAPERASMQSCGRSEDVFAVGCIFVEMFSYTSVRLRMIKASDRPWLQQGWFFQANLEQIHDVLDKAWYGEYNKEEDAFNRLVKQMLAKDPQVRPTAQAVIERLHQGPFEYGTGTKVNRYFGSCCQNKAQVTSANQREDADILASGQHLSIPH